MLFNRTSQNGYEVAAADSCSGIDLLTAQVSQPRHYLKLYSVMRTGSTPIRPIAVVMYSPYDGAIAAYTAPSVSRVEWIGASGKRLDAMTPVKGWVVEEGPRWPRNIRVDVGPPEGRLVALDSQDRELASAAINATSAPPLDLVNHQPIPLAHPCDS